MDIRVGITHGGRELNVELDDDDAEHVVKALEHAVDGEASVLWLNDRSGRRVGVPIDKVAYLELGPAGDRRIGFATG